MIKIFSESIHPIKEIKSKTNYFIFYVYLYIMLLPWNIFNGQMGLLSIILFFWWIFLAKKNNYLKKLKDITQFKPLLILLFFFLFTYISLLWTSNLDNSQDSLRFYKYYWVFVPILFTSLSKEEAQNSIFLFILSLGLYAIVTPYMAMGFLSSILIVIYTNSILTLINNGQAIRNFIHIDDVSSIYKKLLNQDNVPIINKDELKISISNNDTLKTLIKKHTFINVEEYTLNKITR